MGDHNLPYPSLEWVGVDCELIIWRNGSYDARVGAVAPTLSLRVSCGVLTTPGGHDSLMHLLAGC